MQMPIIWQNGKSGTQCIRERLFFLESEKHKLSATGAFGNQPIAVPNLPSPAHKTSDRQPIPIGNQRVQSGSRTLAKDTKWQLPNRRHGAWPAEARTYLLLPSMGVLVTIWDSVAHVSGRTAFANVDVSFTVVLLSMPNRTYWPHLGQRPTSPGPFHQESINWSCWD
jgi:hypothetical protein